MYRWKDYFSPEFFKKYEGVKVNRPFEELTDGGVFTKETIEKLGLMHLQDEFLHVYTRVIQLEKQSKGFLNEIIPRFLMLISIIYFEIVYSISKISEKKSLL